MTFLSIFWMAYLPIVGLVLAAICQRAVEARRVRARIPNRRPNAATFPRA
jgi:hypothetical protein